MADAVDNSELLFFDTFSHENTEELNLDLVQFPKPVIIYEVRIIPLRAQVQANLPGGVRLGATNPSAFKLELFINNLTRLNAATFEKLGLLDYKENTNIQLKPEAEVPTDGLVLKGWYNTVTVAIYGTVTSAKPAKASPPPPPPPRKVQDSHRESRHDTPMTEEELCKSAPLTQHPLDYIQQKLHQLAQRFPSQTATSGVLTPSIPSAINQPKSAQPLPQTSSSRDIYKPFEQLLQPHPRERESHEPKRDYFPPEPKEPYEARERERESSRDPHDDRASRDSRDRDEWDYHRRDRRGSGDSRESRDREYAGSREGSQDSRDLRDRGRDRYRERDDFDLDRDREWERERNRERERDIEREKEKELEREREREQREREKREREQREREQREREVWERDRERERLEEEEREKHEREMAWEAARPRTPPLPEKPAAAERSPSRSRSRSPVAHDSRPPEPPLPPEEEMEAADEGEEPGEDHEMYESLSAENSPRQEVAAVESEGQEEEDGYVLEDISSDDELNDNEETELIPANIEEALSEDLSEDNWSFSSSMFNPLQRYLVPLAMFRDPSLTVYELEVSHFSQLSGEERQRSSEALGLLAIIEQFAKAEHKEKWVTGLEAVIPLLNKGLSYLLHIDKKKRVLEILVEWTMEGLSEEKAMQQPEATFKVRHLKMGVTLATALLSCEPNVSMALLLAGVQSRFLELLESKVMAFSIRLLILKALDASLRFPNGVRWFLGCHPDQSKARYKEESTAYQRLVQLMATKQLAQVMMGMESLLHKAHIYDTFMKLRAAIDHVLDSLPSIEEEETPKPGGGEDAEDEMDHQDTSVPMEEEDVEKIVACLEEIHRLFAQPQHLISQPKCLLPVRSLNDRTFLKPPEVYPSLFRMANYCRLLECLFVLLSTAATASQATVFVMVRNIIQTLLQSQEGLLFLSARPDTTNGIIRSLVQMTDEACEESGEDMAARQLGLEMVYHLYTLQHIDQLMEYHKKVGDNMKVDDAEPLGILHSLYSMTFTSGLRDCVMGRRAIAHVLGLANNFSAILPFIQTTGDEIKDSALQKSVCWSYSTQLITLVVQHSESTQIVEKYGTRLLSISEDAINGNGGKLAQLQEWLAPVKKLNTFGLEDLGTMAGLLKTYSEDVSKMSPCLITVLRLLHHLAIPPSYLVPLQDEFLVPLHHNYVIVELYSADCLPALVSILQKLSEAQLKTWQQGLPQSLDHWTSFFAAVVPAVAIVKATISMIIKSRGSEFKDMTILPTLLELHTVVCSVPSSALYSAETLKAQRDIIDTLLAFTQPDFKSQGEEALSSSMWTLMMKEVTRYAIKSPYAYMSGLLLISELLPLPFPLLSKEPLSEEEISLAVNTRKLWSAHLHPLLPDIHNLISLLASTGCQPLLCQLRRVCWQIADLAAPSATIIAKCLLDVYVEQRTMELAQEEKEGGEENKLGEEEESMSPMTTKILSLISYLLSQPGIKSAILQLISTSGPEEKYKTLLGTLVQTMNQVSPRLHHVQAQEAIMSVLQTLCDQEVTLVAQDTTMSVSEQLANTLPDKELMSQIVAALLEHVSNPSHSYASLLPCVRTLVMLTEHDYGFYHLRVGLENHPGALPSILRHINQTFSKDSSDCLSTLSTILELLRLLTTSEVNQEGIALTRTRTLTRAQLQHILEWAPNRHHPLLDLEGMSKEEEALESLSESIMYVLSLLRDPSSTIGQGCDQTEVILPIPISLMELFTQRSVFALTESDDDRLSASCWLANPALEEPDAEPEVIKTDLIAWCSRYLPDLNLEEELKKERDDSKDDIVRPKRPRDRRKSQEVISINRGKPGKKPFVAPMRGRGIMAQSMMMRGGHDLFRSRPPNTSRPPSMHVDDFVKMEHNRSQLERPIERPPVERSPMDNARAPMPIPVQPSTPVPAPLRRPDKQDMGRGARGGRGGLDRGGRGGFPSRGHFFTPPASASYQRRESSPHGAHNLQMFATQQFSGGSHRPKETFPIPRQFSRGGGNMDNHPRGMMEQRQDGRDNRFSPRGGRGVWFGAGNKDMGPGRFMPQGGGANFHGRRDVDRHQRSFTK